MGSTAKSIGWNIYLLNGIINTPIKNNDQNSYEPAEEFVRGILFSNNFWDFSEYDKNHNMSGKYKFDFSVIHSPEFRAITKRVISRLLAFRKHEFPNVHAEFDRIKRFLLYLETEKYIYNVKAISPFLIEEYIKSTFHNVTQGHIYQNVRAIELFLNEIELNRLSVDIAVFKPILKDLKKIEKMIFELSENRTPNIPRNLYLNIQKCAVEDMENVHLTIQERMTACLITILSNTGMRKGELLLLEANKLEEVGIRGRSEKAFILNFFTYKTTPKRNGKWTKTICFEKAVKAYRLLEELSHERRISNKIDHLYITSSGKRYSPSTFDYNLDAFFYRNQKKLEFDKLTEYERENQIHVQTLNGYLINHVRAVFSPQLGEKFFVVNPHQFRVAIANILKTKISLQWIQKHMNHMSEEMTKHYFREEDAKIMRETLFERASADGSQLETNVDYLPDDIKDELSDKDFENAYQTINDFMKKKKFNIYKDIEEIIDTFLLNPLQETELGVCSNAFGRLCEQQRRIATLKKWYYLSPQVPNIDSFDETYSRFLEMAKIVEHNKTLFETESTNYQMAYETEYDSLSLFYRNRLIPEYKLLLDEIEKFGADSIGLDYPQLEIIIRNFDSVSEEMQLWTMKLNLENVSTKTPSDLVSVN